MCDEVFMQKCSNLRRLLLNDEVASGQRMER
jgi:hypothetical protein